MPETMGAALHIGQRLGHYRLLERLGEGGMGVVWRAEDTRLQRQIALKFLLTDTARDSALHALLSLRAGNHFHFVHFDDALSDSHGAFFVSRNLSQWRLVIVGNLVGATNWEQNWGQIRNRTRKNRDETAVATHPRRSTSRHAAVQQSYASVTSFR